MPQVTLTTDRANALQVECNAYNAANGTELTLDAFVQTVLDDRADAALRQYGVITPYAFVERFTADEYKAIRAAALVSDEVAGLLKRLSEVTEVRLYVDEVRNGLSALEAAGLLVVGRAAQISEVR